MFKILKKIFQQTSNPIDIEIEIKTEIKYDNSNYSNNTGFICSRTKKEIIVNDTILFEEMIGAGTRISTCEATVKLDDMCDGYYLDGFFMDGGDNKIPFQWKLLKEFSL